MVFFSKLSPGSNITSPFSEPCFLWQFSIFQINNVSIQLWKIQPPIQKIILAQEINSFLEDALCIFFLHYLMVWPMFKFTNHQWSEYKSVYIDILLTLLSNFHFHFDILTSHHSVLTLDFSPAYSCICSYPGLVFTHWNRQGFRSFPFFSAWNTPL